MSSAAESVPHSPQVGSPARPGGYRALLRNRAFVWMWLGQTVSGLGNGIYAVGLAWAVYSVTGSAADMGFIMAVNALPQLLFLFLGGVLADRYSRSNVLRASDAAAGCVTLVMTLLAIAGKPALPELAVCAFLLGSATAFYSPSYSAVSGDLVHRTALPEASALLSASANTARIIGPALAGVVYGLGGMRASFGIDSLTFFAAVAATTVVIRHTRAAGLNQPQTESGTSFTKGAWAGLSYISKNGWLRVIIALSLVANAATLPAYFVLLPDVVRSMGGSVNMLGALSAVQVCASIACALLLGRLRGRLAPGHQLYLLGAAVGLGVAMTAAYHESRWFVMLGVLLVGVGFAFEVPENTLLQSLVPREIISRVYSIAIALAYAFYPIGLAGAGVAGGSYGPGPVLVCGSLLLLGTIAVLSFSQSGRAVLSLSAESDPMADSIE